MVSSIPNINNLHTVIWYQVFLSNTNNLHTVIWYQVFLSNTNNLYTVIWYQVFLSNTNNLHTVIWYQIFLPKRGRPYRIMGNVLDCHIIVSSNSSCTITFTFRLVPLRKTWTPLSLYVRLQPWSKWVQTPVMLLHSLSD